MLIVVKEGKRTRPTPTLSPPSPPIPAFLPLPPTPPREGRGGGLFTFYPITCS
jgi:hypothetical protein